MAFHPHCEAGSLQIRFLVSAQAFWFRRWLYAFSASQCIEKSQQWLFLFGDNAVRVVQRFEESIEICASVMSLCQGRNEWLNSCTVPFSICHQCKFTFRTVHYFEAHCILMEQVARLILCDGHSPVCAFSRCFASFLCDVAKWTVC